VIINATDLQGRTALIIAMQNSGLEKTLLNNEDIADRVDRGALGYVNEKGSTEMINAVKDYLNIYSNLYKVVMRLKERH
jgi:hypothetical protein